MSIRIIFHLLMSGQGFRTKTLFALVFMIFATANATPSSLSYQGRIVQANGTPLEYQAVLFDFTIMDPSGQYAIYEETSNAIDMRNSGGVFDVPIGVGTKLYPDGSTGNVSYTNNMKLLDAFNNNAHFYCKGSGNNANCYSPLADDARILRVQFYDGSGWKLISPDSVIRSVPFAGYSLSAQKLGTHPASEFVLKNEINNPGSGSVSCDSGNFLTWDALAGTFGCSAVAGATGGTVTNVTASSPLTVTNGTSTPNITIPAATSSQNGYLSSSDWTAFNNKLDASSTFSGDVSGTSSATSVDKLKGRALSISGLGSDQFLKYNGTSWVNSALSTSDVSGLSTTLSGLVAQSQFPASCAANQTLTFSSPSGSFTCASIAINGSQVTGNIAGNAAGFTGSLAGDVSGTQGATSVDKIKGVAVSAAAPTSNQVLTFNGTSWVPANLPPVTSSQWITNGTSVYYNSGNVGIGTISPSEKLEVNGNIKGTQLCIGADCRNSWPSGSGGTVTSVAGGAGLTGGTITTTGTLAVDVGTTANKIVQLDSSAKLPAVDGSALTNLNAANLSSGTVPAARMPALSGDVTSTAGSTATTLAKIQGKTLTVTSPANGDYLKYNGTAWVNDSLSSADLSDASSLIKSSQMPANCAAGQTLTFSSPTGTWLCSTIANLDASVLTSGTIAAARLPASATYWSAATGGINYAGGNVGIGTTNPAVKLDVNGIIRATDICDETGANCKDISTGWSSGLTNFTESVNTSAPNATVPVVRLSATNAATDVDVALSPKGAGALTAQVADNATTGGNKRGQYAVDWQVLRTGASRVASGQYAVIAGGRENTASGIESFVGGGSYNIASGGMDTTVGGGNANTASGIYATVAGGGSNTASGTGATIPGGEHNTATGNYGFAANYYTTADSYAQSTFGRYNMPTGSESASSWVSTDPVFVIGIGTSAGAGRANAMTVLKNGNVGIGTTSPGSRLDIYGTAQLRGSGTTDGLTVNNLGNVGIGWSNPAALLHVMQQGGPGEILINNSSVGVTSTDGLKIAALADGSSDIKNQEAGPMRLWTNNSERLRIDSAGNVGIGTTAPGQKLSVTGTVESTSGGFKFPDGTTQTTAATGGGDFKADGSVAMTGSLKAANGSATLPSITFGSQTSQGLYSIDTNRFGLATNSAQQWSLGSQIYGTTSGSPLLSNAAGSQSAPTYSFFGDINTGLFNPAADNIAITTGGSERFRIDSSGDVGIGTTTPGSLLEVYNASTASITARTSNTFPNQNSLFIGADSNGPIFQLGTSSGSTPLNITHFYNQPIAFRPNNFEIARITTTGLGIATTSIANKLDVNGRVAIGSYAGTAAPSNGLIVSGNVGIGTTTPRSSLDVNGAITSKPAVNATTTTVDFASNNLAYTNLDCQAFDLWNLKDGGVYSFAVMGTTAGTCSFTAYSGSGSGALTVKLPPDHGATTAGKSTVYSLMVMGSTVFVTWIPGY